MILPFTPWADVNALIVRVAIVASAVLDEAHRLRLDLVIPRARQAGRRARARWRQRVLRAWARVKRTPPTPFSKGRGSRPGVSTPPKTPQTRKGER